MLLSALVIPVCTSRMKEVFQSCTQEDVEDNKNTDDTRNDNRAVSVDINEYDITFSQRSMTEI